MNRPNTKDYKLGKGFKTYAFVSDLTLYIDQLEAEKKELVKFKEFMTNQLEKGGLMFLVQRDKDAYLKLVKSNNKLKQ